MKKLTKLTALALALALVLGMTAFAGTPSEVTKTVTYTGISDFTLITAGTTTGDRFKKGDTFTFGEGGLAYGTDYYQTAATNPNWQYMEFTDINGVTAFGPNKAMWCNSGQKPLQLGFTLPEAWTYNEDYALVAEMGIIADFRSRGSTNYHYVNHDLPGFGGLLTENEADVIKAISQLGADDNYHSLARTVQEGGNDTTFGPVIPRGVLSKQVAVIRPYINAEGAEPETSLDIYSGFDRMSSYNSYHRAGYATIDKVHGLFNSLVMGNEKWGYTGYRLYKVSLDAADFTITSSKNVADVDVKDAINVTFSQPITTNITGGKGSYNDVALVTLEDALTVTPEGGEALVYGEDYTVEIAEKSNGTAIYDELTITPVGAWEYGKNYTVGLPTGLKNIARVEYADATDDETTVEEIKFATVAAPTFDITLKAYKGLSDAGEELDALEAGTNYLKVTASYASGKVVANGKVRIEILDGEGNVVKAVTTARTLTEATTFGAAFKLEAGMTAKAYIEGGVIGEATID